MTKKQSINQEELSNPNESAIEIFNVDTFDNGFYHLDKSQTKKSIDNTYHKVSIYSTSNQKYPIYNT